MQNGGAFSAGEIETTLSAKHQGAIFHGDCPET